MGVSAQFQIGWCPSSYAVTTTSLLGNQEGSTDEQMAGGVLVESHLVSSKGSMILSSSPQRQRRYLCGQTIF